MKWHSSSDNRFNRGILLPRLSMKLPLPSNVSTTPNFGISRMSCSNAKQSKYKHSQCGVLAASAHGKQLTLLYFRYFDASVYTKSRNEIYGKLADLASTVNVPGDKVLSLLAIPTSGESKNSGNQVTDDLKLQIKLGRQNGIHVSPTVLFDGLRDDSVSSSWELDQWKDYFKSKL